MNLVESLRLILLEDLQSQIQQIKDKYVGKDKPIPESDFQKILDVTNNKFYLISWIAKKVGQKIIKNEDIYKYKEYFDLFEKNKNKGKFKHKDIHLYKTPQDVSDFLEEVIKVREGDIEFEETQGKDNFVTKSEVEKLISTGGVKYLGIFDNEDFKYQVFQIFGIDKETWKTYRDILGRCKGRNRGAKIDICTIGDYGYFKNYLKDPVGSSYFVLFNLDDPKSPYQLHHESGQFMDKNDNSTIKINKFDFFNFVGSKVPKYDVSSEDFPGEGEFPIKGKGGLDDRKRKQGLWKSVEYGYINSIYTYENGKKIGPFVEYYRDKKLKEKGFVNRNERLDGEFESYYENGKLESKGTFDDNLRVGIWIDSDSDGTKIVSDYSTHPHQISGFTKTGKLRYVGSLSDDNRNYPKLYGPTILYYPSGSVSAIGRVGRAGTALGEWTYFFPDGSIRRKGKFLRGGRNGEWTDVVKSTDGKKYIFVADFEDNYPKGKIKVYNDKGDYIKSVKPHKIQTYWRVQPSLDTFVAN